jgi:peptide/nickel transport system permease protein
VLVYVLRRVVTSLTVVLMTLIVSFALFFVAPTDPAAITCGARCTPDRYQEIAASLDLDQPVLVQLGRYLQGIFVGRTYHSSGVAIECAAPCLGYSFTFNEPVTSMLARAVPVTLSIVIGGSVVYVTIGVLAGILAARRRGTATDRTLVGMTLGIGSVPYFIFALIVALYATFLPRPEYHSLWSDPIAWATGLLAAWLTLGVSFTASYTRYSRASMIEALGEDYVRTARAKGISERRVVYKHGLRAAITPVATIFGLDLSFQLTGAIFTESIFGLPGLGVVTLQAFNQSDLPVLMGGVLVGSVVLVLMNLVVDLLYTVLDPRVKLA